MHRQPSKTRDKRSKWNAGIRRKHASGGHLNGTGKQYLTEIAQTDKPRQPTDQVVDSGRTQQSRDNLKKNNKAAHMQHRRSGIGCRLHKRVRIADNMVCMLLKF